MSNLIVVSGAAGSGKGTVLAELFKLSDRFRYSVSFTTRKPRPGEVDGVNYFFVTRDEFDKRVESGDFVEHVEYCGNCYGTSRSYIEKLQNDGYDVILEIETVGALNVMRSVPQNISVFLAPPTYTVLENRLRGRGTESEEDIRKRLDRAKQEIRIAENYDYIVLNRDGEIQSAAHALFEICRGTAVINDIVKHTSDEKQNFINSFING